MFSTWINRALQFVLLSAQLSVFAQSPPVVLSARAYGMADAGMTFRNIDAIYYNPAGLVHLDNWAIHANASRRFALSELTQINAGFGKKLTTNDAVFGSLRRFGFSGLNESAISAGYARKISQVLSVAAQFDLYQYRIEGYGNVRSFGYLLALQQEVTEDVIIGVRALNPVGIREPEGIQHPSVFNFGIGYLVSTGVYVIGEIEKDADHDARGKLAFEYAIADALRLRAGMSTAPSMFHSGVSFLTESGLHIDFSAAYHQLLGITPSLGVSYIP